MLRPEQMSRVLLVGPRDTLDDVVSVLYDLRLVHLVDYKGEEEAFEIGKPSAKATGISEELVKLRSISSILRAEKVRKPGEFAVAGDLRQSISTLELNIVEEDASRKKVESLISDLGNRIVELEPFAELGLDLGLYTGYRNIEVFVGRIAREMEGVEKVAPDHELFLSEKVAALFVPRERAEAVRDLLLRQGFSALTVPTGEGDPRSLLARLQDEKNRWQKRLEEINERLEKLRKKYAGFILAAERHLGVEIEKAEAPLRFATSEHTFVIDGWIPSVRYDEVQTKLQGIGPIYLSVLEESREEQVPTLLKNKKPVKPFEQFVHLFSTPGYKELDPTIVLAVIFPIFFGFMIGDAGYGALWLLFGGLAVWKLPKGGFRDLMFAIALGGLFSLICGLLLFGEAFGMPFVAVPTAAEPHPMGWNTSLGIGIPIKAVFHKLENPIELILISLIAAFIHLGIGFIFGIVNEWRHEKKHSIAKAAWLMILVGLFMVILARFARWPGLGREVYGVLFGWLPQEGIVLDQMGFVTGNPLPYLSLGMIVAGIAVLLVTESVLAPFEVPGLFANMISYSRLAGVAMAKAATAMAFNTIIFAVAALGGLALVGALIIAFISHALIFVLGAVSAGIQAIRLNYIEFFLKFFKGNGVRYHPFGLGKTEEV